MYSSAITRTPSLDGGTGRSGTLYPAICLSVAIVFAGCGKSPEQLVAEMRGHLEAAAKITTESIGEPGVLEQRLQQYRHEHAAELAELERNVRKLARSETLEHKRVVTAYCELLPALDVGRNKDVVTATMAGRTARHAIELMKRAKQKQLEQCIAGLEQAR